MSETAERPHYDEVLSIPTLMGLLATYTQRILITNDTEEDAAFANGQLGWDEAYQFGFPKALLLGEVNHMAQWCLTHREACDAAVEQAKINGEWDEREDARPGGQADA